jgi:branched-chain amino acid aminotransferase
MLNKEFYYLNGQIIPSEEAKIHVSDLALLRGYGIFDFFRSVKGKPIFIEDHLDRFENSARLMDLKIPESREKLLEIIMELIRINPHELLGIKMILTGGYSLDGYTPAEKSNLIMIARPFVFKDPAKGIKLMSCEYLREIPEVKTLSYITPVRLLPQMRAMGADDYLYFYNGLISESSRSNIFIVKDQKVITPASGFLPGITRKHVIEACKGTFSFEERDVTLAETLAADEVFTTSSTQRVVAVTKIDDKIVGDGEIGKVTKKLQELLLREE